MITAARAALGGLLSDAAARRLLGGGIVSIAIKVASAALTYLMFVLVARATGAAAFGQFSFGFNLATFLSVVGGLGLHVLIMRWWPEYKAKAEPALGAAALRWTNRATLAATAVLTIGLAVVGVVIGLAASWVLSRMLESMLFHVSAHDPAILVAVGAILALVAVAASAIPAWRAARVDPMVALRLP